jgi:two-component system, cell cycle sensor histidine kinase and response regulator CckA
VSRVLVVDDNAENRYLLRALLTGMGHEVATAPDGADALAQARLAPPDLVVSDILMPQMDGWALCREMKAEPGLRSIPFMFYTATYTDPKDEAFALSLGADRFVVKPQEPDALARMISELLAPGRVGLAGDSRGPDDSADAGSELEFVRQHRDAVIRKLEDKMVELQAANAALRRDVAERLRAEEALRGSEARFQLLAEVSPVGIFQTDPRGATTYVNRRWTEIAGVTAEEALGGGWLRAVHPDCRERLAATWEEAIRTGGNSKADYRFVRPDGSITWVIGQAVAVLDGSGRVSGYVGTITDITDHVRAEEALRASEERYRSLFEQSPVGIYRTTPEGSILLANPTLVAMLGYANASELQGLNLEAAGFGPETPRARFKEALARDGQVSGFESRWVRKDGTLLVVRETAHAVSGGDGRVLYFEGTVEDVSERAKAEEALRRLAAAVDQAAEAVVVTDSEGNIQYVNPAFERITGYSHEEVLGQNPRILRSGQQDDSFYSALWATILDRRVWSGRLVNRRKDGTLYEEEATISPVVDEDGTIVNYVAVKRDVTAEQALREQLTHAQKLEAVGRLAGGIAHDFNNVLQAVLSQIAVLGLRLRGVPGVGKPIEELDQLVRRGAALTRQLLLFSRRDTPAREPADLNDLVRGAATLVKRVVREDVTIVTLLADAPLPVLADAGQCDQVLMNLVVNASDAMPGGGTLTLRTGGDELTVWLSVADTGCGIPASVHDHLFEPFFTTKPIGKGTGLGLSVVHGIVAAHGGSVAVSSREGAGTTFTVTLPRLLDPQPPAERRDEDVVIATGRGERVLLVEDEDGARQGLLEILGSLGYAVTAAASGEEASALAASPPFDLLLTDLVLPGLAGPDLANLLQERWPRLRVVLMSGYAEEDALHRLRPEIEAEFLQKPFHITALARSIRRALDKQSPEAAPG